MQGGGETVENDSEQKEADGADGRVTRLKLSAKGRAIYDEIVPLALGLEDILLEALTPTERAKLDEIMTKLNTQAGLLGAAE